MQTRGSGAALVGLLLLLSPPAVAEGGGATALVTAHSFAPIPEDRPIRVEYEEPTEANLRLVEVIEQELQARGYSIGVGGPARLLFSTQVSRSLERSHDLFSFDLDPGGSGSGAGSGAQRLENRARVPLFGAPEAPTGNRFTLTIRVFDRTSGAMLWQGSCAAVLRGIAGLFLLRAAEFVAAVQVFVYGGGVMVLFVFVIMLIRSDEVRTAGRYAPGALVALAVAIGVVVLLTLALAGLREAPAGSLLALRQIDGEGVGNTAALAWRLYREFLLPFEIASLYLVVAMVGAIALAQRWSGESR